MMRRALSFPLHVFAVLALGLWMGGLVALGAITAPVVFGMIAMPDSADAMAVVFARFDRLVVALAAALLVVDGVLLLVRDRAGSASASLLDRLRPLFTLLLGACGIGEAVSVTPQIASLHAAGAVRGVGDSGARLEALHHFAESLGKTELALAVLLVVLHIRAVRLSQPIASTPAESS
jgi:hypothetical protein